jgi:hypothetical protein
MLSDGAAMPDESVDFCLQGRDVNENYLYTLKDESRFATGAFRYSSNMFLGMPGDTVMLVPKIK